MIRSFDEPAGKPSRVPDARLLLRAVERAMAVKSNDAAGRAQELFYEAMDAPTDGERLVLLEKALMLDAGNIDVLLALRRFETLSPVEEIEFLQKLVKLAEMRLGREAFTEFAGAFWGFHETRPYMRVRGRLAEAFHSAGRLDEAVAEWNGMLELNPNDNQGIRYLLLPALLGLNRLAMARKLIEVFSGEVEYSTVFAWCLVLERFLAEDLPGAMAALAVARKQNSHTQSYVKGKGRRPRVTPGGYSPGSKEEALCFADVLRAAWGKHPAALEWLEAQKGR